MQHSRKWDEKRAGELIAAHRSTEGAALPILHALQREFGYIAEEAIDAVAHALNLSRAEIHGVVTFYHDFRREPAGRHVLKLCRAEACQAVGADALGTHACERLKTPWGGTSADNAVTLEAVFCLGLCATAPAAMLDGRLAGRLNRERLDALIDEARR